MISTSSSPPTSSRQPPASRFYRSCAPANSPPEEEAARILKHAIRRIRRHWPRVEIKVRGDGHYGTPDVMELLEDRGCNYIFGPPGNARLSKTGQPGCEDEAVRRVQRGKDKLRRFFRVAYRAKSRSRERTVVLAVDPASQALSFQFCFDLRRPISTVCPHSHTVLASGTSSSSPKPRKRINERRS